MTRRLAPVLVVAVFCGGCRQEAADDVRPATSSAAAPADAASSAAAVPENPASAPQVPTARVEVGGFTVEVTSVSREASIDMATVMPGVEGITGKVTPPEGSEYLVVHLKAVPSETATQVNLGGAALVDAAGGVHETMLTQLALVRERQDYAIPTQLPPGAEMKAIRFGGVELALPPPGPPK